MKRMALAIGIAAALVASGLAVAQTHPPETQVHTVIVPPGAALAVLCETGMLVAGDTSRADIACDPDPTPTPTEPRPPGTGPRDGVPVCPSHEPTTYHALYDADRDCRYTHEHKDDPRVLDSVFGPVGQHTGGQEISYPWQTNSHLGTENDAKHNVYNWAVVQDVPCSSNNADKSMTNLRLQAHSDGNAGASVRFHSYFLQAELCDEADPAYRGTVSIGGHLDYGYLYVLTNTGDVRVPIAADDAYPNPANQRRTHGSPERKRGDFTWYGGNGTVRIVGTDAVDVQVGLRKEDWGPVDPADPTSVLFYGGTNNGSWQEPAHVVSVRIPAGLDAADGAQDGYVTYTGFTDYYGNVVPSCSPEATDCIPLQITQAKPGTYQFRAGEHGLGAGYEYDESPAAIGSGAEWWIQFPN